jgi:hypothetical protein
MTLDLDVLGSLRVNGAVAILDSPTEGPGVRAARGDRRQRLGIGVLGIDASAVLEINTSTEHVVRRRRRQHAVQPAARRRHPRAGLRRRLQGRR